MIRPIAGQLYGVSHVILRVSNTILYEYEFQNPQIFQQAISLFSEHSTLVLQLIHIKHLGSNHVIVSTSQ
jgi:hypothetical protein